jgi:hypothetical protein
MFNMSDKKVSTDDKEALFDSLKWRRCGERRCRNPLSSDDGAVTYTEKRMIGDRRNNILKFVSTIIFPRGKDSY